VAHADGAALFRLAVADCDATLAEAPRHTKAWFRRATALAAIGEFPY
jgi:hypothetical protein